jgi:hypothetical protein
MRLPYSANGRAIKSIIFSRCWEQVQGACDSVLVIRVTCLFPKRYSCKNLKLAIETNLYQIKFGDPLVLP